MKKGFLTVLGAVVLVLMVTGPAWANDVVQEEVVNPSPAALITPNGTAVGTIHVVFAVNAYTFTSGSFGSFDVNLSLLDGNDDKTVYPLTLRLTQKQQGAGNLVLTPASGSFAVGSKAWNGATTVSVAIPANPPSDDGTTLTGSLQIEADGPPGKNGNPTNPQLNTNTTIVVKVVLVHPNACLKLVNFLTDTSFNALDGAVVNLKTDKKSGAVTVNSTNPGQFSDNVLIVNNCGMDQQIDLRINLDMCFDTNPAGNPGQAVFTHLAAGEVDEQSFDISAFGAGTGQGQKLCLAGLTVPAGQTLLTTVHMGAVKGLPAGSLPSGGSFDFSAELFEPGSENCAAGVPHGLAEPNPASASLVFTTK